MTEAQLLDYLTRDVAWFELYAYTIILQVQVFIYQRKFSEAISMTSLCVSLLQSDKLNRLHGYDMKDYIAWLWFNLKGFLITIAMRQSQPIQSLVDKGMHCSNLRLLVN